MIKNLFVSMWGRAYEQNAQNILSFCKRNPKAKFVDLGCANGDWTKYVIKQIGSKHNDGIEAVMDYVNEAKALGITTIKGDLNKVLPLKDNSYDVVHANQVIEHIIKVDLFIAEIYRILKPGGYAIISTENLSSWHNIAALVIGWQDFSHHVSKRFHVGNPLSPHFDTEYDAEKYEGLRHNIIFTLYSLEEIFKKHGFQVVGAKGAGYYPLPGFFAKIDPRHSHFITIKVKKPKTK